MAAAIADAVTTAVVLLALAWVIIRDTRRQDDDVAATADATAVALIQEQREERNALLAEQREERKELRAEVNSLRERMAVMESRERQHADVLAIHAAWDHKVIEAINKLDPDLDLDSAPPLYPPNDFPAPHDPSRS